MENLALGCLKDKSGLIWALYCIAALVINYGISNTIVLEIP